MRTPSPPSCRLDLAPPLADRFLVGVAPIDYSPVLLLMPFGFHLAVDTLPSGEPQVAASGPPWLVSSFRFRARLGFLHTFHLPRPARHYPRVWIRRSSSERRRDFNPPEQRAAQRTLRTPRTPSRLRETSAVRPYTHGLCPTRLPGRVSPVPRCSFPTCHRSKPRGGPASHPVAGCCLLPSPCYERLDPPEHLSADNVTRLMRSLSLRPAALLPSLSKAFDTPLRTVGSLLPPGVCYRALRRLPGRDFHPLEHRVFVQDAP
jgi:hypothetical protein